MFLLFVLIRISLWLCTVFFFITFIYALWCNYLSHCLSSLWSRYKSQLLTLLYSTLFIQRFVIFKCAVEINFYLLTLLITQDAPSCMYFCSFHNHLISFLPFFLSQKENAVWPLLRCLSHHLSDRFFACFLCNLILMRTGTRWYLFTLMKKDHCLHWGDVLSVHQAQEL